MNPAPTSEGWIDVTLPIRAGMAHWPGDPDVVLERFIAIERGDVCNVTRLEMCAHTGTHMDAPLHYVRDGAGIDQCPLDLLIGPVRVIQIHDPVTVTEAECRRHAIQPGERILFRTQNTDAGHDTPFREDFIYISEAAAHYLANCGVTLVGVDYMSVGGYTKDGIETHTALLTKGVWIIENLDLTHAPAGTYDMICLPLKLAHADGAPCRVLLRPRGTPQLS